MEWIEINNENDLPEEGKYVLARHNRGTWRDDDDQKNVNCVVVKLVRGISKRERKPSDSYRFCDEEGNNTVPWAWDSFGPDTFFGQSITHWTPIIF